MSYRWALPLTLLCAWASVFAGSSCELPEDRSGDACAGLQALKAQRPAARWLRDLALLPPRDRANLLEVGPRLEAFAYELPEARFALRSWPLSAEVSQRLGSYLVVEIDERGLASNAWRIGSFGDAAVDAKLEELAQALRAQPVNVAKGRPFEVPGLLILRTGVRVNLNRNAAALVLQPIDAIEDASQAAEQAQRKRWHEELLPVLAKQMNSVQPPFVGEPSLRFRHAGKSGWQVELFSAGGSAESDRRLVAFVRQQLASGWARDVVPTPELVVPFRFALPDPPVARNQSRRAAKAE